MAGIRVRGYRGEDEAGLIEAWNAALPYDAIDRRTFRRKVLLDPNFDPGWLLVAGDEGEVAGLCLCLIRREPFGGAPDPERGWITAFGVRPEHQGQGIGSALLGRALGLFGQAERSEVLIAPYVPNYFVPGVDETAYSAGLQFLQKHGFEVISRPLSMDANIVLFDCSQWASREEALRERGTEVRCLQREDIPGLLTFLRDHTSYDWLREGRELIDDMARGLADEEQIVVARHAGEVIGYCQFRGEHFGPFGVREDRRGQGVGTVLLAKCIRTMQSKGLHNAWVLWTSDEASERVYGKFGFTKTRRFSVLRKHI